MFPSRIASLGGGAGLQNNYSLEFDGTNDYVSVADSADLSFGDGSNDSAFSISAWVNPDQATNFQIAFKDTEYQFYLNSSEHLTLFLEDESSGNYEFAYYNSAISENTWSHVACTYNGVGGTSANAGITLYVDGINVTTTLAGSGTYVAMENSSNALTIGKAGSNYADGNIDEVSIWNKVLSAGDISTLYQAKGTSDLNDDGNSANLQGWWRMGDGVLDDFNLIADQVNPTLGSDALGGKGDFSDAGYWTTGSGSTVDTANNELDVVSETTTNFLSKTGILTSGKIYKFTYTVSGYLSLIHI